MTSIVNQSKSMETDATSRSGPSGQHLAAVMTSKGAPLEITYRQTPTPGPNELLIEVRSIALNPIDWLQRDLGFAVGSYPAISGSDVAGIVLSVGSSVSSDAPQPGTRVAAFAPCFFEQAAPDYGAFQKRVLVPPEHAVLLPRDMTFNEASMLPMAVVTAWSGWYSIDVPRDTAYTPADKKGLLVWGGASSVGSATIQTAKSMGFIIYTTASEKHHEYLKTLGASRLFDYKAEGVVESIVKAAKEDGVTIQIGYDAVGQLQSCIDVLEEFKDEGKLRLASAIPLSDESAKSEHVEVKFVAAPLDEKERLAFFHFVMRVWLKEKLENGEFVPSPKIKVVEGGLESVQKGLDELKSGVSGLKLVLEI